MLTIGGWRAESTTMRNTLPWRASTNTAYTLFEPAANEYQQAESGVTPCSMTLPIGTRSPSPRGSNGEGESHAKNPATGTAAEPDNQRMGERWCGRTSSRVAERQRLT